MGATILVHPLDLIKNRMQLSIEGGGVLHHRTTLHAARNVIMREGFFALYNGLSAGLLRQGTYGTTRIGIYSNLMEMNTGPDGTPPSYISKVLIGISAGGVSALMWTPTDVCLVRMLADGRLPPAHRRGYTNAFNALYRIVKEEGILTLWRGCIPTVTRAMVVNASELATYTQSKQLLLSSGYFKDNIVCHFGASVVTGLVTATTSTPWDVAKTRIQNMQVINGRPEYKGLIDVFTQIISKEGFFSLWKGFTPYYVRVGPYTVCLFIFMEQLNRLHHKLRGS
ncbi:mitochondrial 2-oxoglutarate/malate carrier protein-like isoform X2 [Amphiura filiformis]